MVLEDLIVRLRIEEDNRNTDKRLGKTPMESKANLVEQRPSKKRKFFRDKQKEGNPKKSVENVLFVINRDIEPMIVNPKDKPIRDNQTKVKPIRDNQTKVKYT